MATLAAVNEVGESVAALLRARRDLLAAAGQLNSLPAAFDITHLSTSKLSSSPPTAGMSLTCYHVGPSEFQRQQPAFRNAAASTAVPLELRYLVAAWPAAPADEQAMIAWSFLELSAHPVLDRSALLGTNVWGRDEIVQLLPDVTQPEALFQIWSTFKQPYHLSFTFTARVIRISFGEADEWPPVVATRFGFADADDPLTQAPA
ncbi:MAG TPA: Pvc16 family protein [Caulobacteraceae bacterium]|nr:Pvc16 family protein [Caulobacteraceae bacterium]